MTGRLHLMYGLAGSGKSTVARRLESQQPAVRFTLDEWMIRLHPELTITDARYGPRAAALKEVIWSVAEQVLRAGTDVVLDWNSWSVARRGWALRRAGTVGADVVLHQLTTSLEDSVRQAEQRAWDGDALAHPLTRAGIEHLAGLMEVPSAAEGLTIVEH